ncbi:DUF4083 family protein [Metabacillus fastidiosus]|uniref:DUF4083 family protein n=1 Tax=Metabacillus fastidiosus TaxID=1458 RepID=UPI002E1E28DC|nr:DUF4083 family protein [Metabacillus fastidiosus]
MNYGDLFAQIFVFVLLLGIGCVIYYSIRSFIRSFVTKELNKSNNLEQKLDRIIELLEKDKTD